MSYEQLCHYFFILLVHKKYQKHPYLCQRVIDAIKDNDFNVRLVLIKSYTFTKKKTKKGITKLRNIQTINLEEWIKKKSTLQRHAIFL
jgi:hypothetical protein